MCIKIYVGILDMCIKIYVQLGYVYQDVLIGIYFYWDTIYQY